MQRIALAIFLCLLAPLALAQVGTQVTTYPAPQSSVDASGTIAVTNTYQQVFTSKIGASGSAARHNCAIQNNGSHVMLVFFGPIANATAAKSYVLNPGSTNTGGDLIYCSGPSGVTLQDQVSITGTSGDAFTASWD